MVDLQLVLWQKFYIKLKKEKKKKKTLILIGNVFLGQFCDVANLTIIKIK
jgi:hypothetical protein